MKGFAAGEEIGKMCEKERKFLVEACDRGSAGMRAEPLTFSLATNVDSVEAMTFRGLRDCEWYGGSISRNRHGPTMALLLIATIRPCGFRGRQCQD